MACANRSESGALESLPYFTTADFTPEWIENPTDIHTIAPFRFTNQNGFLVNNETVKNKIYVANFFFTICPGICPVMTENMLLIQEKFKSNDNILLVSHTVTPWIDNVERLKAYAIENKVDDDKWHLLTGEQDEIYTLAKQSYFADKQIGHKTEEDDFLHTENFILVDKKQRIRGIYNGTKTFDINRLIEDVRILTNEK